MTGTRREAAMTVCAFLNQSGGQVLFGVTAAGVVIGQQVSERTIEELNVELWQGRHWGEIGARFGHDGGL